MFKPFIRFPRLILQVKEPVGVFLLNENIETQHVLNSLRKSFRGVWYFVVPRLIRVRDTFIRNNLRDYRWVRKLRFHPLLLQSFDKQKNTIMDWTPIFRLAREKLQPRHPFYVNIIQNNNVFKNRLNILFYVIDLHNEMPDIFHTLLYPILYNAKRHLKDSNIIQNFPKNIIVTLVSGKKTIFIPVVVNSDYSTVPRVLSFIKRITSTVSPKKKDNIDKLLSSELDISTEIPINKESISSAIVLSLPKSVQSSISNTGAPNTQALVFSLANKIIPDSVVGKFEPIDTKSIRTSISRIVPFEKVTSKNSIISNIVNHNPLPVPAVNTTQKFSEIESKQVIPTLLSILKVYENTDISLKVIDYSVKDEPIKENEVSPSVTQLVTLKLQDKDGAIHTISLRIPKPLQDGSYFVYGNRYITVKQIYPIPIIFPKKGTGRYSSYTVTFTIQKMRKFSIVYVLGVKVPLTVLMCYLFGFDEVFSRYKIPYTLENEVPKTSKYVVKVGNKFLVFPTYENLTSVQKDLINSLFNFKGWETIQEEFPSKEFFVKFIELYTGNDQIPTKLEYIFNIAVDPRTFEILKEKSLPTTLFDIFQFMHKNVILGYVTDRNSLIESRIRGHEAIAHIAFDVIRKSIAEYSYKKKQGKLAKIQIQPDSVLSSIITSSSFQLMEYVNPIEELQQHYKVTYSGYNGIPKDSVSDKLRSIHTSAFGTIDPIDVPVGASIGVVQHLTMNQILTYNGGIVPKEVSDLIGNNILSFSTASIPFVSRNEPTRVMMGSNQSRQAVLLTDPEPAIVQTGVESLIPELLNSDIFVPKSPCDGIVKSVTKDTITIKSSNGECKVDITPKVARSGQSYSSLVKHSPRVKVGQKVSKGTILTNNNALLEGIISYGRNLVTTYAFWKGFTYEDGVVVSEDVVDSFTSIHSITLSTFVDEQDRIIWINPKLKVGSTFDSGEDLVRIVGYKYLDLLDAGVIDDENLVMFGNRYKLVTPYKCKVTDIKIYLSDIPVELLDPAVRDKLQELGFYSSTYVYKGQKFKGTFIKITIEVEKKLELGDKLTNRHASKGVVCLIEPVKNMPKLPDGRHVQIIINPMSYINRTNVGQLYELYVGEIGYQLLQKALKLPRNKFLQLLGKVMINLDKDFYGSMLYSYLSKCSEQQYKRFIKFAQKCKGIPILVPPFKEPSYKNILKAMQILKIPEKYTCTLHDGTKKKLVVGMQYILKLEHMSSHKVYSRSLGPYQRKTGQPTQGKARGGGQRLGEGDVWSLLSWGADNVLKEFFSAGSDDFRMKQQLVRQIIEEGSASLEMLKEGEQQSKKLIDVLFKGIMLNA